MRAPHQAEPEAHNHLSRKRLSGSDRTGSHDVREERLILEMVAALGLAESGAPLRGQTHQPPTSRYQGLRPAV